MKFTRVMQSLNQSTWDHEIFYTDRSSKDEQRLVRQFLWKENMNMEGSWKLKFKFLFMQTTPEPL
jgi:hypothetical protein